MLSKFSRKHRIPICPRHISPPNPKSHSNKLNQFSAITNITKKDVVEKLKDLRQKYYGDKSSYQKEIIPIQNKCRDIFKKLNGLNINLTSDYLNNIKEKEINKLIKSNKSYENNNRNGVCENVRKSCNRIEKSVTNIEYLNSNDLGRQPIIINPTITTINITKNIGKRKVNNQNNNLQKITFSPIISNTTKNSIVNTNRDTGQRNSLEYYQGQLKLKINEIEKLRKTISEKLAKENQNTERVRQVTRIYTRNKSIDSFKSYSKIKHRKTLSSVSNNMDKNETILRKYRLNYLLENKFGHIAKS